MLRRLRSERGASAVEFPFIAPLLIVLLASEHRGTAAAAAAAAAES